ncbi:hypothetical protein WMF37_50530 [Sorangium sp. So ce291]|uniref:hypothetical protein n=1 Tax=Sorangium sp. So ce291 TaxID=3133294 RepID=UPI003F5FAB4D
MLRITHAQTGALEDLTPGRHEARRKGERYVDAAEAAVAARPRGAAAPGEARVKPAPAQRCVTARAVRSDMLLVLLAALAALAAGGALGCGHACNHGFSPCPMTSSASSAPGASGPRKGSCPSEYRPLCLGKDTRCATDNNGCQVCDCVDSGSPASTLDRRDVQEPHSGR